MSGENTYPLTIDPFVEASCYIPESGDVIIVKPTAVKFRLSCESIRSIKEQIEAAVPDTVKVIVLAESLDISVIRNGEQA